MSAATTPPSWQPPVPTPGGETVAASRTGAKPTGAAPCTSATREFGRRGPVPPGHGTPRGARPHRHGASASPCRRGAGRVRRADARRRRSGRRCADRAGIGGLQRRSTARGGGLATAPDGWARVDPPAVEGLALDPVAAASPPGSGSGSLLIGMTDATGQFLLPTTFLERLSELPKAGDRVRSATGWRRSATPASARAGPPHR